MNTDICARIRNTAMKIWCVLSLCILFGCVTYLDGVTEISISGKVQCMETGTPIPGVALEIGRSVVMSPDDRYRAALSNENGYIYGHHEIKWGYGQTSIGIWREKVPVRTIAIRLPKEGYYAEEFTHELTKFGHVTIDIGTKELKKIE